MSRVGKLPVAIPAGVTVSIADGVVTVKGSKGTLTQALRDEVVVEVKDNEVVVTRKNDEKASRSFHGLYRQLIANMIKGVSEGYSKVLLINGVGYRAEVKGSILTLNLGYSTPIEYMIPEGISIAADGPAKLTVSGINKARVGQVAAEIRSLRGPEPYKGKGIKYETETIRRKVGKSGGKK
ncbi:MAG TPA: 50S ribosomal protein L6 [Candidatus Ornithospirochaeta stercorigallinarum]|nr:50S ribosomal protein L6 [Candidatus Ornithospirochaeta stercorigallinarum]